MTNLGSLTPEQSAIRAKIKKTALIWATILGLIVLGIAYWALSGQTPELRWGGAILAALLVGFGVFKKSASAGSDNAKCISCNTAFSISKTDSQKTMVKSEPKESREKQENGTLKLTRWTEETFDVIDTYTCSNCANITTKAYQTHTRSDEVETIKNAKTNTKKSGKDTDEKQLKSPTTKTKNKGHS